MKSKELYRCDFCGKSFVAKINLYRHLSKNKDCYDFYYHDKVENVDYVTCRICGKRLNNIYKRHLKTHNITTEEYKLLFPDAVLTAQETINKWKETNLARYGVKIPAQSEKIKNKMKQTNLKKYNCEYVTQSEEIKNKMKQTCLKNYNCEYSLQSKEIQIKAKQKFIEKYGVKHPSQSKEIQNKIKQTSLKKYNCNHFLESEEVKNKIKQTNLEKYNCEYPMQSKEIRNKAKQKFIEKYGVENPFGAKEIKDKIKYTNLKKYNVENPMQSAEVRDKTKHTCLEKYGTQNPAQSEKIKNKIRNTMKQKYGIYYSITPRFSLSSQELFNSIELIVLDLYPDLECFYATNKEIVLGGKLVTNEYQVLVESVSNDKKVRFLDFYIPELKKWIEFDESYHDNVDQLCDDEIREEEVRAVIPDIQLLRVKEEDYLNDKDYVIEKCIDFILS